MIIEGGAKGILVDISEHGAGVLLGVDTGVNLAIGTHINASIGSTDTETVIQLPAQVRYRVEFDGGSRYGLSFLDTGTLSASEMALFRKLVNRRAAYRVSPKPGIPIDIEMGSRMHGERKGETLRRAQVVNISATGMALVVSEKSEAIFSSKNVLPFTICLTPKGTSFTLVGKIQNRCMASDGVRYGVAFDLKDPGYLANQERLVSYIMERQRAYVQKK